MTFSVLTEQEYQKFISNNDMTSFMQTVELSNLKKELGSKVHFVGVKKDKKVVAGSMILEDTTILNKKLFYAPRGLIVDYQDKELLDFFTSELKKYIKSNNGFILTIDPNVIYRVRTSDGEIDPNNIANDSAINNLISLGYKHHGFNLYLDTMQARWCYRISLDEDYESKKVKFSKSTRKNIDFCVKKGLMVREGTINDLEIMSEILRLLLKEKTSFQGV